MYLAWEWAGSEVHDTFSTSRRILLTIFMSGQEIHGEVS